MPRVFTREQVERYHREGVLFPVPALSRREVERFCAGYFDLEARLGGKPSAQQLSQTHLYFRWAYDLATHPAVLDAVEAILGPNILVWTVSIFPKHARDPGYISWHQDGTYFRMSGEQIVSVWVMSHGRDSKRHTRDVRAPTGQRSMMLPLKIDWSGWSNWLVMNDRTPR